ncbi:NADPH:quinone reductase-like Zn-dependent oxidoreductase [Actinopolyspora biskrensis]|uniref:NADPH:quinone reductase-like Zn-dependent oxidoreductase n=1 Tax=Actinopolyspora biskrensis TaxID=1470178 RepID=A0A852YS86_9ACTN|nr:NADP-dependent oxidoreductase [Actinopolyspora biskrensis]NYH76980.1 NADPH:quinone reductase-like Zn-dependent oxidoreductase [Actinopolyspora biskrensis]
MRAIQFSDYGSSEVLKLVEVGVPEPGAGQVRVAVRVAGVNPLDWKLRSGVMTELSLPRRPGMELAGVVDAVGASASFEVGDEVFGWAETGSYAEYALASLVARKPAELSWRDAAALPVAGATALRVLRQLELREGEVLLLHGASGAVGRFATQLAVDLGATVIGTAGEQRFEDLRSLGATPVAYGAGLVERVREITSRVDAVFDAAGQNVLPESVKLRGTTDRVITIADPRASELGVTFSSGGSGERSSELLDEIVERVVAGKLSVRHARAYPLSEAAAAQDDSETGHSGGKITLDVV